jgi:hypothetical protein
LFAAWEAAVVEEELEVLPDFQWVIYSIRMDIILRRI